MKIVKIHIFLAILEFIACSSMLILKKLTDTQADRLIKYNQKISNEWRLLNNLSWTREGDEFSTVLFGGYTLITMVLIISRIIRRKPSNEISEKILLFFGAFCFLLEGCLIFISVEEISEGLHNKAYTLGGLCFLNFALFTLDNCYFGKEHITHTMDSFCQTESPLMPLVQYSVNRSNILATEAKNFNRENFITKATFTIENENNLPKYTANKRFTKKPYLTTDI